MVVQALATVSMTGPAAGREGPTTSGPAVFVGVCDEGFDADSEAAAEFAPDAPAAALAAAALAAPADDPAELAPAQPDRARDPMASMAAVPQRASRNGYGCMERR
jgi:hypothetical protein